MHYVKFSEWAGFTEGFGSDVPISPVADILFAFGCAYGNRVWKNPPMAFRQTESGIATNDLTLTLFWEYS